MKRPSILLCLMGLAAAIAAALVAALDYAGAANLLSNGGFNGFGGAWVPQAGINGVVPVGWTDINLNGYPKYANTNGGEKTEGDNAFWIESQDIETNPVPGKPFTAALYQRVSGVLSGTAYSFAAAMLTACGGFAGGTQCADRNYTISKVIGIDPSGGVVPGAPGVVWSPPEGDNQHWRDLMVAARTVSTTLTVFIMVDWRYQWHGALGVVDAAYLAQAPTATLKAYPLFSTGAITVEWDGRAPQDVSDYYPGFRVGFDVQRRIGAGGAWTNWFETTEGKRATYAGAPGQVHQFRARPVIFQPNDPDPPTRRLVGLYTDPVAVVVAPAQQFYLPLMRR